MTFSIIDIGRTGAGFSRYWLDNVAHNLANVNTVRPGDEEPFRARVVEARALTSQDGTGAFGVGVADVHDQAGDPMRVYDPGNPLADEGGYVNMPVVDMPAEMVNLIQAQRSYQLSMKVIQSGHEAYQSALRLGNR
ncbi:MAG TPA: flagellar basal body rod C-terminal domain-containing protein [Egibacteraceae bacterium]|nr:flagellar basal body rod C-terminal domain-containing protein [Egibacteraceae bacterium]